MTDRLKDMWYFFVLGGGLWLAGFWVQKVLNATGSGRYTLEARASWTWLFGVRPGRGRLSLPIASMQTIAIVYLFGGCTALWFWDASTVRLTSGVGFLVAFLGNTLGWTIIDYVARMKHRRAAERDNSTRG